MKTRRAITGKTKIKFENRDDLVFNYCSYRKTETKLELYNIVFTQTNARDVARKLPYTNHRDKVLPNFKIYDEKGNTLVDSKFDNLDDFLDL